MRKYFPLVIAVWAGAVFGLVEGILLDIGRNYPAILAPYKLSEQVIWFTPLYDILLFSLAGVALIILFQVLKKWIGRWELIIPFITFIFLGAFGALFSLNLIHPVSVLALSLGVTVGFARKIWTSQQALAGWLSKKILWVPGLLILLIAATFLYSVVKEASQARQLAAPEAGAPNVLVIVMDTVRYDRFNLGEGNSITPNIDRLVKSGVRYTNAWSTTSWSLPSQASIMTGLYPHEHGADWPVLDLNSQSLTLAKFFSRRGYVTGAFSGNSAWITPEYLGKGFLRFLVYSPEDFFRRTSYGRIIDKLLRPVGLHSAGRGKKAGTINAEVLDFLNDYPDHPYFMYLCYMDVNQAFHNRKLNYGFWESPPSMEEVSKAYDEGLRALDRQVGELMSALEQRGALENTLIVITSDHGESFGEEKPVTQECNVSDACYEDGLSYIGYQDSQAHHAFENHDHIPSGHGTSLYPEQTRVPLFIIYPPKIPAGQVIDQPTSIYQIAATIDKVLGLEGSPFEGDQLPLQESAQVTAEPPALLATLNYREYKIRSVIWRHYLYLQDVGKSQAGEELFDLVQDPFAQENVAVDNPLLPLMQKQLAQLLNHTAQALSRSASPP